MNPTRPVSQDAATVDDAAEFGRAVFEHCTRLRASRRSGAARWWRRLLAIFVGPAQA